ncbi:MAG: hypothetical protein WCK11_02415 [Candidatus Falkowbacteria bacterium]
MSKEQVGSSGRCFPEGAIPAEVERIRVLFILQPQQSLMGKLEPGPGFREWIHTPGERPVEGIPGLGEVTTKEMILQIVELVDAAEAVGIVLVVIMRDKHHYAINAESTARGANGAHCVDGTPGIRIEPRIELALARLRARDKVGVKIATKGEHRHVVTHSIGDSPDFAEIMRCIDELSLDGQKAVDFFVCGVTKPYAVYETARTLQHQKRGGDVYILDAAISDRQDAVYATKVAVAMELFNIKQAKIRLLNGKIILI